MSIIDVDAFVIPPADEFPGLDEKTFNQIKSWIKGNRGYSPKPPELDIAAAVKAMLRRWGLIENNLLWLEAEDVCLRLYNARLKDKVSRSFWSILRYNVKRLL